MAKRLSVWVTVFSMLMMMCSFPSMAAIPTIYGSGNEGMDCTIELGGDYIIGEGATGTITISTPDPVTLIGSGTDEDDAFENLAIDYTSTPHADLTLQDVYIYNEVAQSVLKVNGDDNALTISGTCIIDHDVNANPNAAIHVDNDDFLEVRGNGTLYMYKRSQGAGIGGDTGELNGNIIFNMEDGHLFLKGTKQGAVIGAGANSATAGTPGEVTFISGTYNLMSNARGACVGGSAGSNGASAGTVVTIEKEACVNINVDWNGAAIGGGGYAEGNDSSGGTLVVNGGSLRCFIDQNAITNWGVSEAGVNDKVITAQRKNSAGETVYRMTFDTAQLSQEDDHFNVSIDGDEFYSGGLHQYGYVNEQEVKEDQAEISSTMDNWYENGETNLYFYVTGEDHTVTVNDEVYLAEWDEETQTFSVEPYCSVYFDNVTPSEIGKNGTFTADLYIKSDTVPGAAELNLSALWGSIVSIDCNSEISEIRSSEGKISFFGNTLSASEGLKIASVTVQADGSGNDPIVAVDTGAWTQNGGTADLTLDCENAWTYSSVLQSDLVSCTSYAGDYYLIQYTGNVSEGYKATYNGQDMLYSEKLNAWVLIVNEDVSDTIVNEDVDVTAAEGDVSSVNYSGDVNLNDKVTIIDAQIAYDLSKGDVYTDDSVATLPMWYRADVNGDGAVSALDARAIQKIVHGIDK